MSEERRGKERKGKEIRDSMRKEMHEKKDIISV